MRIAIVVDYQRTLMGTKGSFRKRTETLVGRKTILVYTLDEINQDAPFEMIQSLIGSKKTIEGLLVCQPSADPTPVAGASTPGNPGFHKARMRVEGWLKGLTHTRGIQCRQEYYDPKNIAAPDEVLAAIDAFPVMYVRNLDDLKNSANPNRFLRPAEVATIFSELWREINPSGVRHLPDLIPVKIGKRSIGYRESDVYDYLQKKLSQENILA
ncbi:MAG: hypothetical protein IT165_25490 [Bryobacterales bacterium]|nr:hypothetical protein [Bryobacterales bacterium]